MLILSAKQKAFAATAAIFAFAVLVGTAIQFIAENVPGYVILYVAVFAFFAIMFNLIYQVMLCKFNSDVKVDKIIDKMVDK